MNGIASNGHAHGGANEQELENRPDSPTNASSMDNVDGNPSPMQEPSRELNHMDVAALIINKMIGTGIFYSPFTVLFNCENKRIALGLWFGGYAYTFLSMLMYMEFARKLPFTGGELVYLDDVTSRFPLLTTTLYAFYFVFVYTTSTNAMYFAAQILLAASAKTRLQDIDLDERVLRFLAVVITTVVCLVLYLSSAKSRILNILTAAAKVSLLFIICVFGCYYLSRKGHMFSGREDWNLPTRNGESSWQTAIITILFSFHGWENATLVSGEIPSFTVLRKGTIWALVVVGGLYLWIAILVSMAFTWTDDAGSAKLGNYTAVFLNVKNNSRTVAVATAIIIAVSALGSMISVTYTCVRVKQSIGWTNILPLSFIWRRSGPLRPRYQLIPSGEINQGRSIGLSLSHRDPYAYLGTPEGGIVLHWIVTVFYICVTSVITSIETAIDFSSMLLVYGHLFIQALVGIGFIWFDPVDREPRPIGYPATGWFNSIKIQTWWTRHQSDSRNLFQTGFLQVILGLIIFLCSLTMIVLDSWRGRDPERKDFVRLIITIILMGLGVLYWLACINPHSSNIFYQWFNCNLLVLSHGIDDNSNAERVCRFCQIPGVELRDRSQQSQQSTEALQQAEAVEHRHTHFGYCKFVSLKHHPKASSATSA